MIMSSPRTLEAEMLAPAARILAAAERDSPPSMRADILLRVLEKASSIAGGYDHEWYCAAANVDPLPRRLHHHAELVIAEIPREIPTALALSSLAAPNLAVSERRRDGAYYTDHRLARLLAGKIATKRAIPRIVDSASGTGALLAAAAMHLRDARGLSPNRIVAESLYGSDLSRGALRGAALAIASLSSDRKSISSLLTHLRQGDSLKHGPTLWHDVAPEGFDVVIGNPPWEKLKLSAHEFLQSRGAERHYGADFEEDEPAAQLPAARQALKQYVRGVEEGFTLQGNGDPDAYKLFLELAVKLVNPGGEVLFLIPAGLIRSQGTSPLRQFLFDSASALDLMVFDNRPRYFAIDSRFKFLALRASFGSTGPRSLLLRHGASSLEIDRTELESIRPDRTIPEVRTSREWALFLRISKRHPGIGSPRAGWGPQFMREVDMTKDRPRFRRSRTAGAVAVIEGRMVHQFRHDMKRYVSGTGRRAVWQVQSLNAPCGIHPQFWYPKRELPTRVRDRIERERVGFCDITGQTNERSMLAAMIPANVVCGNKVPTMLLDASSSADATHAWIGIANSFVFDWLLRRLLTTTVNYFILESVPMPAWDPDAPELRAVARLARRLTACPPARTDRIAGQVPTRLELEWRVAKLYGVSPAELELIMDDFPLLDRGQPPIFAERRSTVTRDQVLLAATTALGSPDARRLDVLAKRVEAARAAGATAFVPSEAAGHGC